MNDKENPQRLLDALDVLTQSHINHAKPAFAAGASGILFSIATANRTELSPADYAKFSAPFGDATDGPFGGPQLVVFNRFFNIAFQSLKFLRPYLGFQFLCQGSAGWAIELRKDAIRSLALLPRGTQRSVDRRIR